MSFVKNLDQENQHVAHPTKELRPKGKENAALAQKRPLASKNAGEKRFKRVPLGGKDQNSAPKFPFAALQRSQSSLPQKLKAPQLPTTWQPSLGRSNSSLGFSHPKPALSSGEVTKEKTDPQKNELLSGDMAARSSALVPRFSTDSLAKPEARSFASVPKLQLSGAPQLHASRIPEPVQTREPEKRVTMESLIESLAEDESSVEHVPERCSPLREVPVGVSPLSGPRFSFLEPELPQKLAPSFECSSEMSFDEMVGDKESTCLEQAAESTAVSDELDLKAEPLGLSEQELNDLLDY